MMTDKAMQVKTVVAVLDTMWGYRNAKAPRYFEINPYNHSGKRLYKLVGPFVKLLVTNSCREMVNKSHRHGKPDPEWLLENLRRLAPDLILVCGKVAQDTYRKTGHCTATGQLMEIPHPAARCWTKAQLKRTARQIQKLLGG